MDLRQSRIDSEKEVHGVWVDLDDKTKLLIARWNNPAHAKFLKRAMEPYRKRARFGQLDDGLAEKITREGLAKYILLDWKGLKDNGKDVPYSQEKALEYLSDPTIPWFADTVTDHSMDMTLFREGDIEEAEDNLKK